MTFDNEILHTELAEAPGRIVEFWAADTLGFWNKNCSSTADHTRRNVKIS
jgi:hypothetical protein